LSFSALRKCFASLSGSLLARSSTSLLRGARGAASPFRFHKRSRMVLLFVVCLDILVRNNRTNLRIDGSWFMPRTRSVYSPISQSGILSHSRPRVSHCGKGFRRPPLMTWVSCFVCPFLGRIGMFYHFRLAKVLRWFCFYERGIRSTIDESGGVGIVATVI
jgi:hypothetical protein